MSICFTHTHLIRKLDLTLKEIKTQHTNTVEQFLTYAIVFKVAIIRGV